MAKVAKLKPEESNFIGLTPEQKLAMQRKSKTTLLIFGIFSICMMFGGLTSAYWVRRGEGDWISFEVPGSFYTSTGVILLSSAAMVFALTSIKKGNSKNMLYGLAATFVLGLLFFALQWQGWQQLVGAGVYLVGNPSGSFFYLLTGLHLAHLVGGLLYLIMVLIRGVKGVYSVENHISIKLCGIYWHFLGILWIYLFLFLVFIR